MGTPHREPQEYSSNIKGEQGPWSVHSHFFPTVFLRFRVRLRVLGLRRAIAHAKETLCKPLNPKPHRNSSGCKVFFRVSDLGSAVRVKGLGAGVIGLRVQDLGLEGVEVSGFWACKASGEVHGPLI